MNREELQLMAEKEQARQGAFRCRLLCCASTPCLSSGGDVVRARMEELVKAGELKAEVEVVDTGCMGPCSRGPLVTVQTPGAEDVIYEQVTPEIAERIVAEHVGEAKPVAEAVMPGDLPFFAKQKKVVLSNSGRIDPERLEDAVANEGYAALAHVVREMSPEEVCAEITRSGLRGRGGAGYPTGLKWDLVRKAAGDKKYVVANGDEGDPGAYMDRTDRKSVV